MRFLRRAAKSAAIPDRNTVRDFRIERPVLVLHVARRYRLGVHLYLGLNREAAFLVVTRVPYPGRPWAEVIKPEEETITRFGIFKDKIGMETGASAVNVIRPIIRISGHGKEGSGLGPEVPTFGSVEVFSL